LSAKTLPFSAQFQVTDPTHFSSAANSVQPEISSTTMNLVPSRSIKFSSGPFHEIDLSRRLRSIPELSFHKQNHRRDGRLGGPASEATTVLVWAGHSCPTAFDFDLLGAQRQNP
jgi:hypothetical protein